ncbi:MAG: S8 family peptidase [Lachnospiraceae bacterium]|nr:S8 family peptidase [Lachnospiraceae bacterium]
MERMRMSLHADEVHRAGFTGRGITVCSLDSGAALHPDFTGRIVGFADFVKSMPAKGMAASGNFFRKNSTTPGQDSESAWPAAYDDASHGTHVLGIIGGDGRCMAGRYRGIAPGSGLFPIKVLDRHGEGDMETILRAIDWVIAWHSYYGIRILNISAGGTKTELEMEDGLLVERVEEAWDAGLVVVVAAGNNGPLPGSVTVPGNSKKVITVGTFDLSRSYSGRGPTWECVCKPDLVAPGTAITSCASSWTHGRYYSTKSGTSMSAPAISGAVALLLEKEPYLTNVEVKMRLKECAADLGLPQNWQGWGMPDLRRLLRL